jgi:dihydroxyacetone kinase-like protein
MVFVNGAGGMTEMEQYTLYGEIESHLVGQGFHVEGCKVGNYLTTQELSGVSVSLLAVDDEMMRLWNAPCNVGKF